MQNGNGIDQCDCCGRDINPGRAVWLELDHRIDAYHDYENVPEAMSQGWSPFGPTCAARLLREARAKAKAAGVYLGKHRLSAAKRAQMFIDMKKLGIKQGE
jgi:hypothetical protein